MIITKRTPVTIIDLWYPKYSTKYSVTKEFVFLPAVYKVRYGERVIIVEFSRAHSEKGLRYALLRSDVMKYPIVNNGKIDCYEVPKSAWEPVETVEQIIEGINLLWPTKPTPLSVK